MCYQAGRAAWARTVPPAPTTSKMRSHWSLPAWMMVLSSLLVSLPASPSSLEWTRECHLELEFGADGSNSLPCSASQFGRDERVDLLMRFGLGLGPQG